VRVFDAVAAARVPALVYASSVGAYSPGPKDVPVAESWPTHGWPEASYTREKAYAERLPRADKMLSDGALERDQHARDELDTRLSTIESAGDVAALGSPEERDQWARIQKLEAALVDAPNDEETNAIRDRLRLVKGVLYFRLNESFKARIWRERRSVKDLDLALHEAQARLIRVEKARQSVPTNTGEFATRIAALQQRIDALQIRLVDASQKQSTYLAALAVKELEGQKDRLATYQIQARFALASMYDRAANSDIAQPKPARPKQQGDEEENSSDQPEQPEGAASPDGAAAPAPEGAASPAPQGAASPDGAAPGQTSPSPAAPPAQTSPPQGVVSPDAVPPAGTDNSSPDRARGNESSPPSPAQEPKQ